MDKIAGDMGIIYVECVDGNFTIILRRCGHTHS